MKFHMRCSLCGPTREFENFLNEYYVKANKEKRDVFD